MAADLLFDDPPHPGDAMQRIREASTTVTWARDCAGWPIIVVRVDDLALLVAALDEVTGGGGG